MSFLRRWTSKGLAAKLAELEARQAKLERDFKASIDNALRSLGQRVEGEHPTATYFNVRFRQYELAMFNIKQLGYEFARTLAQTKGLGRTVSYPPATNLKSSLCTQADVESDWFAYWCREMRAAPIYHRKMWEMAYICQALWGHGKLHNGQKGLGFGCGREPLPSLFAKYGGIILATDLDPTRPEARGWTTTGQHSGAVESIRRPDVCPDETLLKNIDFRLIDMNDIPADLDGQFDFCWSVCALEHLGSIEKGLAFIENSLKTLKPGGVAVHTTEFNFEDGETIDNWGTVLFQRKHLEEFSKRLKQAGHEVAPLNFDPGNQILDGWVDIPPYETPYFKGRESYAHLKLCGDGFPLTSVGLIIKNRR